MITPALPVSHDVSGISDRSSGSDRRSASEEGDRRERRGKDKRSEKGEKGERNEKGEKDEKGDGIGEEATSRQSRPKHPNRPSLPSSPGRRSRPSDTAASADESITAWALAARTGDPEAVDRFVRALHRDVVRYVAYLSADPQAADDLAQDTFLRALGSLHRFEGRCSARTWLLAIARRAVVDSLRYAAARPRLSDVPDWRLAVERAQPRGLPGFDDGVALLDLLAALPDERREAFVLTQMMGLPYAEAAELSNCPIGTVRSRVARARATLVGLLAETENDTAAGAGVLAGAGAPAALAA